MAQVPRLGVHGYLFLVPIIQSRVRLIAVAFGLLVAATPVRSQGPARIPIPYRTYIAVNPLGIPFDVGSIEVESGVAQGITVGGQGSYTSLGDDRYSTVDAKVRYYPSEIVLRGFSLGVSVGHTHFTTRNNDVTRRSLDFGTIGLLLDYNWMLGMQHRFIVGSGVGAKRVLANADARDAAGLDHAYLTARFVVGLAF
jgi:hypothetical protein